MKNLKCLIFNELPKDSIDIRNEVFVVEQGFKEEFDTIDHTAIHFVVYHEGEAIGTARIYFSKEHNCYSLGRFAIIKAYRKQGVGTFLIKEIESYIITNFGHLTLGLSSQKRAIPFYKKCGYHEVGEPYLDENYPHIWMIKEL